MFEHSGFLLYIQKANKIDRDFLTMRQNKRWIQRKRVELYTLNDCGKIEPISKTSSYKLSDNYILHEFYHLIYKWQ
jgi:hypothetical protein